MKRILSLLFASALLASASPQTSDADLKATQFPVNGFTLSNITNSQLDAYVFNNCTFLTNDSSSGHPFNITGTDSNINGGGNAFSKGVSSGKITLLTGGTSTLTVQGTGSAGELAFSSDSTVTLQIGTILTSQTTPLKGDLAGFGSHGTNLTLTANNVGSFLLGTFSPAYTGNVYAVSVTSATSVDVSSFSGMASYGDTWNLTAGQEATAVVVAGSIPIFGSNDTWSLGRSDSVDAVWASYAAGAGATGSVTTTGATPSSGGLASIATCISNGITVSY